MSVAELPPGEGTMAPDQYTASESPETLDKAEIEMLGRQRPAALRNALTEVGFVASVIMSMMMSEYFISGFNLVLPAVSNDLNIPESARTWPAEVINLTTAAFLLPCARLCDMYSARVVFLCGHGWLFTWSLVAGFSTNSTMLIVCRALQGLGASAFMPAGIALIGQTYRPGPRKNLVFGIYGAGACTGFYIGILIGAISADLLTWKWYFYIGSILVVIVFHLGVISIPTNLNEYHEADDSLEAPRMDWLGVITTVPGIILVVFALTDGGHAPNGWATPYVYVTFLVGVLLLCAAVYVEGWVASQPLLPPEIFRPKYMKRLMGSMFCCFGVFGIYLFYASYYIETVIGIEPLLTAAWFVPLAAGGFFIAVMGGFFLHRIPARILLIMSGLGLVISCLLYPFIPVDASNLTYVYWAFIFPAMLCQTIGADILFNISNIFITTAVPHRHQSSVAAVINSLVYLGIAFWLGVADLVVSTYTMRHGGPENIDSRTQYQIGFWTGAALGGCALLLSLTAKIAEQSADLTADEKEKKRVREEAAPAAAPQLMVPQKNEEEA